MQVHFRTMPTAAARQVAFSAKTEPLTTIPVTGNSTDQQYALPLGFKIGTPVTVRKANKDSKAPLVFQQGNWSFSSNQVHLDQLPRLWAFVREGVDGKSNASDVCGAFQTTLLHRLQRDNPFRHLPIKDPQKRDEIFGHTLSLLTLIPPKTNEH